MATVPFTVVSYSEPHSETAVEVPPTPFAQPPEQETVAIPQSLGWPPAAELAGDTSDSGSDSESEGRERTADEKLALEMHKEELRRSGLSPTGTAACQQEHQ